MRDMSNEPNGLMNADGQKNVNEPVNSEEQDKENGGSKASEPVFILDGQEFRTVSELSAYLRTIADRSGKELSSKAKVFIKNENSLTPEFEKWLLELGYEKEVSEWKNRFQSGSGAGEAVGDAKPEVTTVYLVRHGTTAWNQALRYQGRADNPLDEAGERQGACLKEYFKDIHIDLGVTSPLQRAKKTLEYCLESQDHEVPVIVDPSVTEIDFGEVEGWTKEEIRDQYPEFYRIYVRNEDRGHSQAPGGESLVQVYERMRDGVLRIAAQHLGENIVIASHGTAIQSFLNFAYGIPALKMKRFLLYNVSVSCIEIDADGKPAVRFVGDKHHVPEELQFSYGSPPKN